MEIWEKYNDLWERKMQSRPLITGERPIVYYLDGQSITRNHTSLFVSGAGFMPEDLAAAAESVAIQWKIDCVIYSFLDELSFILLKPYQAMSNFSIDREPTHLREMLLQRLLPAFQKSIPGVCYWIDVFEIESSDIDRYISYRREYCYSGAVYYFAKEYFNKDAYRGKSLVQVENLLKTSRMPDSGQSYYDTMRSQTALSEGVYKKIAFPSQSALDTILNLLKP